MRVARLGRKVPEITAFFWIIKVLTTAMGEATSDYSVHRIDPVTAVIFGFIAFAIALGIQLSTRRYNAWAYWGAVVMVAVFGTMCADVIHIRFGVPYFDSTAGFAVILAVVFLLWHHYEGTLSIHSIDTRRRELFYWATVLSTFALGTAAGDMTAYSLHLGFFSAGLLFTAIICIPVLAYYKLGMNPVLAFWFAYVVTRPLGASFADWMGVPRSLGGLDMGRGFVAIMLTIPIVVLVAYLSVSRLDVGPSDVMLVETDAAARLGGG